MQAILTVYSGSDWMRVTGRIVRMTDNGGCIIDDADGVRWFANAQRTQLLEDATRVRDNSLWN